MTIKHRLNKLEGKQPKESGDNVRFISWVGDDGERVGHAVIASSNHGFIEREVDETEDAFRRRVYAMSLANKPLVQMSDADLEQVLAAADERLAKELVDTGTISDASLERVVSTGSTK